MIRDKKVRRGLSFEKNGWMGNDNHLAQRDTVTTESRWLAHFFFLLFFSRFKRAVYTLDKIWDTLLGHARLDVCTRFMLQTDDYVVHVIFRFQEETADF